MNIEIVSVDSLMLYFEQRISEEVLDKVQRAYGILKELEAVIDITPSYCSLLIRYDIESYNYQSIQTAIKKRLSHHKNNRVTKQSRLIQIPTRYDESVALDLQRVAKSNHLSIDEVIEGHTKIIYRVYAIGFMVGFAYLAKVDKKIATPRLSTPRAKVPKGSVAIANEQTAIYPQDSAGGWNIIGHTDFDAFETFSIGDRVQFVNMS